MIIALNLTIDFSYYTENWKGNFMGILILRVLIIGCFVFIPIISFIYGYKHITKEDFRHTAKITFAGVLAFSVILGATILENQ